MRLRTVCAATVALLALGTGTVHAQLDANLGALSGENAKGYLGPLPTALSGTLNSAIFQSGDVPRAGLNFQVGVHVMSVVFDDGDRTYAPNDPDGFTSQETIFAPTLIGDPESVLQQGVAGTALYHPGGFDIDDFALAVPQITIGSAMGTRAVVRYIAVDLGDENEDLGKLELLGVGAQHSISQYAPSLPVDLALGGFYQEFNIGDELLETTALHFDVTASKAYTVLAPYAAIGYDTFDMKAKYDDSVSEPIEVEFEQESGVHLTFGLAANLAVVRAHVEYNIAAANGIAFGLSFGH